MIVFVVALAVCPYSFLVCVNDSSDALSPTVAISAPAISAIRQHTGAV